MIKFVGSYDICVEDIYMYLYICTYNYNQLHNIIISSQVNHQM